MSFVPVTDERCWSSWSGLIQRASDFVSQENQAVEDPKFETFYLKIFS